MGKGKKNGGGGNASKAAAKAAAAAEEDAFLDAALNEASENRAAEAAVVRVDNTINATKPETDKKQYRIIELAHGLECLLIQDAVDSDEEDFSDDDDDEPEGTNGSGGNNSGSADGSGSDGGDRDDDDDDKSGGGASGKGSSSSSRGGGGKRAACAMAVGVGSWADPPHVQGCAHFLEHLLFMGTAKYPQENHYDRYLQTHGGSSNAFTECEYTVYHFDVFPKAFQEALNVFAQFFIDPLFQTGSVDRELKAIESEFVQNCNSDGSRLDELLCRTLAAEEGFPKGHPYSNFTWGNKASLVDEPLAAGVDAHAAVSETSAEELFRFFV